MVWMVHEISNVRNHCAASLDAVGHPVVVAFMKDMTSTADLSSVAVTLAYIDLHEGEGGRESQLVQSSDLAALAVQLTSADW